MPMPMANEGANEGGNEGANEGSNEGAANEGILKNRYQGHRDSTYAMLMQLVATNRMSECLRTLERMASTHIGCWRDVRGFIRHFEAYYSHAATNAFATNAFATDAFELIQGCVRMTNAQLRKDCLHNNNGSLAAKWVPREPKCRGSTLLMWYYEALAADMFPGAPDAKRRYRKLISSLTPLTSTHSLAWFVKQAERVSERAHTDEINALWLTQLGTQLGTPLGVPVLSLAHSMGPGHNNCLHAGIGLALYLAALSSCRQILTFSSHAEWHMLEGDFVAQAQQLLRAARSPTNGLNANLTAAMEAMTCNEPLVVISDMEHDEPIQPMMTTWNVSRNGRPATICGDRLKNI
jgi:hypothetical protein